MITISLHQPWASFMAYGLKQLETRDWKPYQLSRLKEEGLLIQAAKTMNRQMKALCSHEPYASALDEIGMSIEDLPLGCIVAKCRVIDALPTALVDEVSIAQYSSSAYEYGLGNYGPNRFFWICRDLLRASQPIEASGSQKFWHFELPDYALNPDFWLLASDRSPMPVVQTMTQLSLL